MSQNISWLGNDYPNVPWVELPKTGGGTALFSDATPTTATVGDVVSGKIFINSSGNQDSGTLVIQHYFTGSGAPSSSTGVDGDIYLQTS